MRDWWTDLRNDYFQVKRQDGDNSIAELQANDGVLLKGKLGEYADAFSAVDKDGNGEPFVDACPATQAATAKFATSVLCAASHADD